MLYAFYYLDKNTDMLLQNFLKVFLLGNETKTNKLLKRKLLAFILRYLFKYCLVVKVILLIYQIKPKTKTITFLNLKIEKN